MTHEELLQLGLKPKVNPPGYIQGFPPWLYAIDKEIIEQGKNWYSPNDPWYWSSEEMLSRQLIKSISELVAELRRIR